MAEFLVELYLPSAQLTAAQGWAEAASMAATEVSREGDAVRYVRSIVVPEDETFFLLYEARSIEAVRAAAERAGLGAGRISKTWNQAEGVTANPSLPLPRRLRGVEGASLDAGRITETHLAEGERR